MNVRIIDNWTGGVGQVLSSAVARAYDVRIAVAFVSKEGLDFLWNALRSAAERGATIEFIVGLDGRATEPQAVSALFDLANHHETVSLWCWDALEAQQTFHPKLYFVRRKTQATCLIGSSNLTRGGLKGNIEVNVLCQGSDDDELVCQAYNSYLRIKQQGKARQPDAELLCHYEELWRRAEHARKHQRAWRLYAAAEKHFRGAIQRRPRIRVQPHDLHGWLDLVYDVLPDGEFTNQQVYQYEESFRRRFPHNQNIQAKIRQKLQELRDLGFIEHLGPGRWRKL